MLDIDVFDPAIYLHGHPHHLFKRLRAECPVYWQKEKNGRGYWAITKHADIAMIGKDPLTFSSRHGGTFIKDYDEGSADLDQLRYTLPNMDPPDHVKYRNIVRRAFMPRIIQALEGRIRERVTRILDRVNPSGGDFVLDVAQQLPIQVIADMLGIPDEDRDQVFDWGNRLVGFDDPDTPETYNDSLEVAGYVLGYFGELVQKRFEEPKDDIASLLLQADVDGHALEPMEVAMLLMLLIVAGHETTRNTIAGGMLALTEHPAQRDRLLASADLLPTGIEEMLRWVAPITYFRRTAMKDLVLRGQEIKAGDKVVLYYPSGNHDEEVFANADEFDVGRTPNEHLSFGMGQHVCIGSTLARLEIKLMFEQLLARFPNLRVTGPIERYRSNFVSGIRTMPVEYAPAVQVSVAG